MILRKQTVLISGRYYTIQIRKADRLIQIQSRKGSIETCSCIVMIFILLF